MSRIVGITAAQKQPIRSGQTESGLYTIIPYESTVEAEIANLETQCIQGGLLYDRNDSFGKFRIDIRYPYNFNTGDPSTEQPINSWEFTKNRAEKDLLESALPFGTIGTLTAADALLVQTALSIQQQGVPINANWFTAPTDAAGAQLKNAAGANAAVAVNPTGCYSAFLLKLRGFTSFPVFAPVLRHTQTVNSYYPIKASFSNVGRIITTATMLITEAIPIDLLFNLPNNANPSEFIETAGDLKYGWFKDFPDVRKAAGQKVNIEQEWQYGLWPVKAFGQPI